MEDLSNKTSRAYSMNLSKKKCGEVGIWWDDGMHTIHKNIPSKPLCKNHPSKEISIPEFIRFDGQCRNCFTSRNFFLPGQITSDGERFYWQKKVKHTLPKEFDSNSHSYFGPTKKGDHFGVGDLILWDNQEGEIKEIHRYKNTCSYDNELFLIRIYFPIGTSVIDSKDVEVLTCDNVSFPETERFKKGLKDICKKNFPFNPKKAGLEKVFIDDIARAVWVGYRANHSVDGDDLEKLKYFSLLASEEIGALTQEGIDSNRLHLIFKHKIYPKSKLTQRRLNEGLIAALVPYFTGEEYINFPNLGV